MTHFFLKEKVSKKNFGLDLSCNAYLTFAHGYERRVLA